MQNVAAYTYISTWIDIDKNHNVLERRCGTYIISTTVIAAHRKEWALCDVIVYTTPYMLEGGLYPFSV